MNLAQAIREGSKVRKQCYGQYFLMANSGELRSCALGAAFEGTFGRNPWHVCDPLPALQTVYPELDSVLTVCPECDNMDYLGDTIWHLNDKHRWPRLAIADWLDSLTLDLVPAPVRTAEVSV